VERLRILVTNDDGIAAPALAMLAGRLARDGHAVTVAAPLQVESGCGASIGKVTEGELISVAEVSLAEADGIPAFAIDAPPSFIVLAALQGLFGESPDVVVSGPNSGLNLGPLVLHSGTLGAAVTAASKGLPGIALSTEKRARHGFASAAEFCARNLPALLEALAPNTALNINLPDRTLEDMSGTRLTRFAPRSLVDIVLSEHPAPVEASSGQRQMVVTLDYDVDGLLHRKWRDANGASDDTDAGAIIDGFISVTVVHGGLHHLDGTLPLSGAAAHR
jgi:5'-nucleotidase